jgi:adenine-specific DNA-methyltransferase
MTEREIRSLLEQPYGRERWKSLVTALFPKRNFYTVPKPSELDRENERKYVKAITHLGDVQLTDDNTIGFFEVELLPGVADLARNKVAIRKTVDAHVHVSGHAGALIGFHDPDKGVWRFSYYSRTLGEDGKWETAQRKRYTYLLGEGETCRTAAEQFHALQQNGGQVTLKDLQDAFSVEKVSKVFFREYKEHYQDFVQHLTGKRMVKKAGKWTEEKVHGPSPKLATYFNGNEKDARDFCKKLMGRLVFLYFLQKKRWLGATTAAYSDGEQDFVFKLFGESGGNDAFYPNVLVDLFFDTLNAERKDDVYKMPDGTTRKVPFLNGGLFDMDELDRRTRLLTFPPKLFSNPPRPRTPMSAASWTS